MPQHSIDRRKPGRRALTCAPLARIACGAALAGLAICAGTAMAYGDDTLSSSTSFYDKFLQTIGVEGGSPIDYSERSPLVVPPTRDLPPPVADRPPPLPDWPKDPDLTRKEQAKAKEKPKPHQDYVVESSRPLTPSELDVPGAAPPPGTRDARADPEAQDLSPAATQPNKPSLFSFDLFKKEEYATFTGEPARTSLTDPPPGYLTPSPDQPFGIGPEQSKQYKVPTVADRMTPTGGTANGH